MVALAEAAQDNDYPAEIVGVISNQPKALGLKRARALNIPTKTIDHKDYESRRAFEHALNNTLILMKAELVCCAGFMRILTPWFVSQWQDRLINIHPSLLPKYKGLNTHQRAIESGDENAGCTVHWVTEELDGGSIILQQAIAIQKSDTAKTLADRLLPIELELYPEALRKVASNILKKRPYKQ